MEPRDSGRLARRLEPLHALSYFAPEVTAAITDLGVREGRAPYFAGRAAAFGRVGPGAVAATFYVFNPAMVAKVMAGIWDGVEPTEVVEARRRGVDGAYRRLLGDDVLSSPDVAEAADLVRIAAEACEPDGRALYAAHADLDWPTEPHLALWHGLTLLREHRGDGHVASLQFHDLSGIEALVSHVATGKGFTIPAAQATRAWSEEQWDACASGLAERGLMTADGALTEAGQDLRRDVEHHTDRLAAAPWTALGEERAARLAELALPLVQQALAAGAFPDGVFASR